MINKTFEDKINPLGKSYLLLDANKPVSPSHITYPILWSGFLNNEKVVIKQKGSWSSHFPNYEFLDYPIEYSYLQKRVIDEINEYLKIID